MATSLTSVLTWTRYFWSRSLKPDNPEILEHVYTVRPELNDKVSLWQGDITTLKVEAIVNAANETLLGGGGVDGQIHMAAGPELMEECKTLNGCPVGQAKITGGYNLPSKYVIHAVGTQKQDPVELQNCYKSCFSIMLEKSIKSIAFPCISTGIYGYDTEQAAHLALHTARDYLTDHHSSVDRIIFCVYLDSDLQIYEEIMQRYFPVKEPPLVTAITPEPEAIEHILMSDQNVTE